MMVIKSSLYLDRVKRERIFFDNQAQQNSQYWGWTTKVGCFRHILRGELVKSQVIINKDSKILELGCGLGGLTEFLATTQGSVYVIDISAKSLNIVKRKIKSKRVKFSVQDAHSMKFPDLTFDAVVGNGILHHLDLDFALPEIYRVLKPKAKIFFIEPNLLNPEIFIERKIPLLRKLSKSTLDESAFIRWNLEKKLKQIGFIEVSVQPYDFLYPALPFFLAKPLKTFSDFLEKISLIKEIAGSLIISSRKPG